MVADMVGIVLELVVAMEYSSNELALFVAILGYDRTVDYFHPKNNC